MLLKMTQRSKEGRAIEYDAYGFNLTEKLRTAFWSQARRENKAQMPQCSGPPVQYFVNLERYPHVLKQKSKK